MHAPSIVAVTARARAVPFLAAGVDLQNGLSTLDLLVADPLTGRGHLERRGLE